MISLKKIALENKIRAREYHYLHSIPYLEVENYEFDKEIVKMIPEEMARTYKFIALDFFNNLKILTVVTTDPDNLLLLKILSNKTGYKIKAFKGKEQAILKSINKHY